MVVVTASTSGHDLGSTAADVKRMLDKLGLLPLDVLYRLGALVSNNVPTSPVKRRCSSMFVARRLFTERGTTGWTHLRDARRENEAENVHTKEIGTSTP